MTINSDYNLDAYSYDLPEENIAHYPAEQRDQSRLLVMNRKSGFLEHKVFPDILEYLHPSDLLVLNNTRVFPARLLGTKETGGRVEFLLLEYPAGTSDLSAQAADQLEVLALGLVKSSKKPKVGGRVIFGGDFEGIVHEVLPDGKVWMKLIFEGGLAEQLERYGQMPLPPYIRREGGETEQDRLRYQTVFASKTGAVAAPTAGLHFTEGLLSQIKEKGVKIATVTLHVGYGTFSPVRCADIREHNIHSEFLEVPAETVKLVNAAKDAGGKIWAVGTTSVRALEFASDQEGILHEKKGLCDLYIYPGYKFQIIDNMVTNFHLPRSSLLFLVSALVGREQLLDAYREAIRLDYRFYSYGDAMAIVAD